ncbi:hypothetical protein VULLAG_LOCUS19190 [Vulpes lagopus]
MTQVSFLLLAGTIGLDVPLLPKVLHLSKMAWPPRHEFTAVMVTPLVFYILSFLPSKTLRLVGEVEKPKARNLEAQQKPLTLVSLGSHHLPCELAPALFH